MTSKVKIENNCKKFQDLIAKAIEDASKEIGITGVGNIQANTPVLTGNLRRSITFRTLADSTRATITFGSSLSYAEKVELLGKSKGFMRNTMREYTEDAMEILMKHLKKVGR